MNDFTQVPTTWRVPDFPHDPVYEPEIVTVDDAYLTRLRKGRLKSLTRPDRWLTGAVHESDGTLVEISQKIGGLGGSQLVAADPGQVNTRSGARRLGGTWLYGGHWIHHFGHFISEVVTTLWPREGVDVDRLDGVVFHAYGRHHGIKEWEREMFDLTRYTGLPVEVVSRSPVWVDRLVVPSRGLTSNGWAHPEVCGVYDDMRETVLRQPTPDPPTFGERVFVSRRSFNLRSAAEGVPPRTTPERDAGLERVFAAAGFHVVEPETLSIPQQVRLGATVDVLAGSAGTALHLSAFGTDTRVIELGDPRSAEIQVQNQTVIDAVRQHPSAYIPFRVGLDDLPDVLAGLGL